MAWQLGNKRLTLRARNRRHSAKQILKIAVDVAMTIALLLLMAHEAYELIGQTAHEWLGIGTFTLFVLHHILNRHWHRGVFKGRYTAMRWMQTTLVILILLTMCGSMVSGILLSRYALPFLPLNGGGAFARNIHMLSAYWGFVLMSLHLGFHWSIVVGMAKKIVTKPLISINILSVLLLCSLPDTVCTLF